MSEQGPMISPETVKNMKFFAGLTLEDLKLTFSDISNYPDLYKKIDPSYEKRGNTRLIDTDLKKVKEYVGINKQMWNYGKRKKEIMKESDGVYYLIKVLEGAQSFRLPEIGHAFYYTTKANWTISPFSPQPKPPVRRSSSPMAPVRPSTPPETPKTPSSLPLKEFSPLFQKAYNAWYKKHTDTIEILIKELNISPKDEINTLIKELKMASKSSSRRSSPSS